MITLVNYAITITLAQVAGVVVFVVLLALLARWIRKHWVAHVPVIDVLEDGDATKIRLLNVTKTNFDDNIYVVFVDGDKDKNIKVLAEHEFLKLKSRNH